MQYKLLKVKLLGGTGIWGLFWGAAGRLREIPPEGHILSYGVGVLLPPCSPSRAGGAQFSRVVNSMLGIPF